MCAAFIHHFLICKSGIQEYFADEVIEHEVIGQGGFGMVRRIFRACSLFCSKLNIFFVLFSIVFESGQESDDTAQPVGSKPVVLHQDASVPKSN
jgi:hypothetical protein